MQAIWIRINNPKGWSGANRIPTTHTPLHHTLQCACTHTPLSTHLFLFGINLFPATFCQGSTDQTTKARGLKFFVYTPYTYRTSAHGSKVPIGTLSVNTSGLPNLMRNHILWLSLIILMYNMTYLVNRKCPIQLEFPVSSEILTLKLLPFDSTSFSKKE